MISARNVVVAEAKPVAPAGGSSAGGPTARSNTVSLVARALTPKQQTWFADAAGKTTLGEAQRILREKFGVILSINRISVWLSCRRGTSELKPDPANGFTATEFESLSDAPRGTLIRYRLSPEFIVERRYGEVHAFSIASLPQAPRIRLEQALANLGCANVQEALKKRAQRARKPSFSLNKLPSESQKKAALLQAVMNEYFRCLDCGQSETAANRAARRRWSPLFKSKPCSERTIRRRAAEILRSGGPQYAPIEAYADRKSVPHYRSRKNLYTCGEQHHVAAVTTSAKLSPSFQSQQEGTRKR